MQSVIHNLTATSNAIDTEVLAKHRQLTSESEAQLLVGHELHQLAHTRLETASPVVREAWLKRLFANLHLYHLRQVGEAAAWRTPQITSRGKQEAEVEVVDILVEKEGWERLRVLGSGSYEQLIHQLCALATMGLTLTATSDEYVRRFCLEYKKFANPNADTETEQNWLPLLLSLQTALKASPIVEKASRKPDVKTAYQVIAQPQHLVRRPPSQVSRERIVSFSAVLGLLIVCGVVLWGGPNWKRNEPNQKPTLVEMPASPTASATPHQLPSPTPKSKPTPAPPAPVVVAQEKAGFYVIGVAARQEASAQAEAQMRQQEGLSPRVVYSSDWSGLTPNYYLVVYDIFANRADTVALRKDLEKRGIKTYMMHSGKRVRP